MSRRIGRSLHFLYACGRDPYKVFADVPADWRHARRCFSDSDFGVFRGDGAAVCAGAVMIAFYAVAGALLGYLVFALLKPEKF
jgi:K+-transporting ATPase KdpF subunit